MRSLTYLRIENAHAVFLNMKSLRILTCAVLLLAANRTYSQSISGVINDYYIVTGLDKCNNSVTLSFTPSGLAIGDHVMLIQMRGVDAEADNTALYGSINNIAKSGTYELFTVQDIVFNVVTLNEVVQNLYTISGVVQLVRVPYYNDVTIAGTVTGDPWNGSTGGIVAMISTGTITFNADIDATGIGFRGADVLINTPCITGVGPGANGYVTSIPEDKGAKKGEGISENGDDFCSRGAPANGGGGGNDRQTGGGGGSNNVMGGTGGQLLFPAGGLCGGTYPGIGGWALSYNNTDNRIWMGGGGGAGSSNLGTGTGGGNGGGIVLIQANNIAGNNFYVRSNGASVSAVASDDGAGGGGGAGTTLITAVNISSTLNVQLHGGDGGNVDNSFDGINCVGPGGGGSGGILWMDAGAMPGSVNLDAGGGAPGITVGEGAASPCFNSTNSATSGSAGNYLGGLILPISTEIYTPLTIDMIPDDAVVCQGNELYMEAVATGTGSVSYHWNDPLELNTPSITTIPTVDFTYQVTITDDLGCSLIGFVAVDVVDTVSITAFPDSAITVGQSVTLHTNMDVPTDYTYLWTPDYNIDDVTSPDPVVSPFETTTYCCTVTHPSGCNSTDCITILVAAEVAFPNAFTPNGDGVNDVFRIPPVASLCEDVLYFRVYNRWGQLMYSDIGMTDLPAWDGTDGNGITQEVGTYLYVVKIICDGVPEIFSGAVHLLR